MTPRTLKIEIAGDFFRRRTHPKIRLEGQWLARLGFPAGGRVEVVQTGDGVVELRTVKPSPALERLRGECCAALERANTILKARGL
jgi:hypothetical protein